MAQRFHNVQALRGVACLLILLVHLRIWDHMFAGGTPCVPGYGALDYFGIACVDLFFVLSGFIIFGTNRKYIGRPTAVPGYLFRRAWRIYPTYWAGLALMLAARGAFFGWPPLDAEDVRLLPEMLTLAPLPLHNPLLNPAWTLTYEVMFYAAFGALLCLPPRAAAAGLGAWGVVVTAGLFTPGPTDPWAVHPLSPFVLEFLGGCLIAWLAGRGALRWPGAALVAGLGWGTAAALILVGVPGLNGTDIASQRVRVLGFGPAVVLLVYAGVAAEGRWPRRVPRWLLLVGDASYSLYLSHFAVLTAALYVGMRVPHTRLPHLLGFGVTLAVVFAVGFAFYALVEKPLLNVGRRRPTAVVGLPPVEAPVRRAA